MSSEKRRVKAEIDTSMLEAMQARVAGRRLAVVEGRSSVPQERPQEASHAERVVTPRPVPDRATTSAGAAKSSSPRTTLSVPKSVGEHARRLTMALTLCEGLEASLGETIKRGLMLLEAELTERGVKVPEANVKLRAGPRHL